MHLENLVRHGVLGIAFYKLRTHPSPYGPIAEPFSVSVLFAKLLNDAAATMPGSLDDVLAFNVAGYKIDDLGEREFSFRLLGDGEIFDKELSVRVPRPVKTIKMKLPDELTLPFGLGVVESIEAVKNANALKKAQALKDDDFDNDDPDHTDVDPEDIMDDSDRDCLDDFDDELGTEDAKVTPKHVVEDVIVPVEPIAPEVVVPAEPETMPPKPPKPELGLTDLLQAKRSTASCMFCNTTILKGTWRYGMRKKRSITMSDVRSIHIHCLHLTPPAWRRHSLRKVQALIGNTEVVEELAMLDNAERVLEELIASEGSAASSSHGAAP